MGDLKDMKVGKRDFLQERRRLQQQQEQKCLISQQQQQQQQQRRGQSLVDTKGRAVIVTAPAMILTDTQKEQAIKAGVQSVSQSQVEQRKQQQGMQPVYEQGKQEQ